ncbi:hypothetical protein AB0C70_13205 [Streptomyces sp. NPDC048564]|uniref:hypothetical protein n=1 Tax=Streptomyces sp. NPDC048564 TaxID=3155760 RepID=UPI003438CFA7
MKIYKGKNYTSTNVTIKRGAKDTAPEGVGRHGPLKQVGQLQLIRLEAARTGGEMYGCTDKEGTLL